LVIWTGEASRSLGKIAGSDSINTKRVHLLEISISIVPLLRGWLDGGVFSSRSWNFDRNLIPESENLSDGNASPKGTMPMYPTALVMARNLRVALSMTNETNRYAMSQVRGSAKAGWGPFSVRANYFRKTTKTTHDFVEDGAGLSAPGMQVLGFVCTVLDKCPNADESLKWT